MSKTAVRSFLKYIRNGEGFYMLLNKLGLKHNAPDETHLKHMYKAMTGHDLNLDAPQRFMEKMQWLKLYDRKAIYTDMVDKYKAKEYVNKKLGDGYTIPTLGVWEKFEDIDFDSLPNQFVLKCTHDSGGLVIVKDKKLFNKKAARKKIEKCLKRNFFYADREWPYKDIKKRIIAEPYLEDESGKELKDYKIFCFHGEPKIIQLDFDRFIKHKRKLYDTEWKELNVSLVYPSDNKTFPKPECLDKVLDLARELSKDNAFLRTDFYIINDKIFFGEMTFYPEAGFGFFIPDEYDLQFGALIKLPDKQ